MLQKAGPSPDRKNKLKRAAFEVGPRKLSNERDILQFGMFLHGELKRDINFLFANPLGERRFYCGPCHSASTLRFASLHRHHQITCARIAGHYFEIGRARRPGLRASSSSRPAVSVTPGSLRLSPPTQLSNVSRRRDLPTEADASRIRLDLGAIDETIFLCLTCSHMSLRIFALVDVSSL